VEAKNKSTISSENLGDHKKRVEQFGAGHMSFEEDVDELESTHIPALQSKSAI
jgi:hypothetical protein